MSCKSAASESAVIPFENLTNDGLEVGAIGPQINLPSLWRWALIRSRWLPEWPGLD